MEPEFSIVLPVFNGERCLVRAVESVKAQSFSDWELIVVDDGSTDGSADLVARFAEDDRRIRLVRVANSGGPARPRNIALKMARGRVACFLDQDDYWAPEKLAAQRSKFAGSSFAVVYSDAYVEQGDRKTTYSDSWGPMFEGHVLERLVEADFIPMVTACVRMSVVREVGLLDESLSGVDDYDYWLRVARAGLSFGLVDQVLATWCVHDRNLSGDSARQQRLLLRCLDKHRRETPEVRPALTRRRERVRRESFVGGIERALNSKAGRRDRARHLVRSTQLARRPREFRELAAAAARLGRDLR